MKKGTLFKGGHHLRKYGIDNFAKLAHFDHNTIQVKQYCNNLLHCTLDLCPDQPGWNRMHQSQRVTKTSRLIHNTLITYDM